MELNIYHLAGTLVAGGCMTPVVQWAIDKAKGKPNRFAKIHKRIDDHEAEDNKRFEYFDRHSTERHEAVMSKIQGIGEDVAFIKGKLDKSA